MRKVCWCKTVSRETGLIALLRSPIGRHCSDTGIPAPPFALKSIRNANEIMNKHKSFKTTTSKQLNTVNFFFTPQKRTLCITTLMLNWAGPPPNLIGCWSCTFPHGGLHSANVKSLKQVVVLLELSLSPSFSLHLSLPPSLPLAVTPLPLSPSSLGRIKGWGRGSLCRLCWDLWSTDLIFTLREKLAALMWGGAGPRGLLK